MTEKQPIAGARSTGADHKPTSDTAGVSLEQANPEAVISTRGVEGGNLPPTQRRNPGLDLTVVTRRLRRVCHNERQKEDLVVTAGTACSRKMLACCSVVLLQQ